MNRPGVRERHNQLEEAPSDDSEHGHQRERDWGSHSVWPSLVQQAVFSH